MRINRTRINRMRSGGGSTRTNRWSSFRQRTRTNRMGSAGDSKPIGRLGSDRGCMRRSAFVLGVALVLSAAGIAAAEDAVPVVPTDHGHSVQALLYARPFTLTAPYTYTFVKEQPAIRNGYILALAVDPALAQPHQTWTPVLYVGTRPAELTNLGEPSGHLVVIVPDLDLRTASAYFGSVQLPERVDAARGALEQAAAERIGIRPFPVQEVEAALAAGGDTLRAPSINDVYRAVAGVILTYAPEDRERAEEYLLIPAGR